MAYVPKQIPEEEENKFSNPNPTTPYPETPEGGGSAGTGSNAAPGVGTSTQFGSNAAKLSDYLSANKDQVQNFGNEVAGKLNAGYDQTMGSINQGFGDFNQQVNQGYAQDNPDLINQAATNPTEFVKDQNNVSQFQSLYGNQYKGPQNFESTQPYMDINANVNKAVESASTAKSPTGLSTYLSNEGYYPNATQGVKALDSALLMGNPNAQKSISDAASKYSGLTDYLGGKTAEADTNAVNAKKQADSIRQGTQDRFMGANGVIPTFQNQVNQNVANARQQATDRAAMAKNALGFSNPNYAEHQQGEDNYVSDEALQDLGISRKDLMSSLSRRDFINRQGVTAPVDLSSYFGLTQQSPEAMLNAGNVSSADDYAKSIALQQLTGQDMSGLLNPSNASKAGTANLDLSSIDPSQIAQLLQLYQSMPNLPLVDQPGFVSPEVPDVETQPAYTDGNGVFHPPVYGRDRRPIGFGGGSGGAL